MRVIIHKYLTFTIKKNINYSLNNIFYTLILSSLSQYLAVEGEQFNLSNTPEKYIGDNLYRI